jgi:Rne/Rng family ribonuclease
MSKELVIAANRHETKVALLEDDQLVEVFFQRANEYSLAGSIHKGRVTRVLPGMQSAFVDLGLDRDTFLYVSDFFEEEGSEDFDRVTVTREEPQHRGGRGPRPVAVEPRVELAPAAEVATEPIIEDEPRELSDGEAAVLVNPSQPRQGTPPTDRQGDGDRDQRGRRSRRRRNRGRGFPDSKYASAEPRYVSNPARGPRLGKDAPAAGEESSPVSTSASAEGGSEFSVLPGESLAKYTGANIQPLDDGEEEEIRNLQEEDTGVELEASIEVPDQTTEDEPSAVEEAAPESVAAPEVHEPEPHHAASNGTAAARAVERVEEVAEEPAVAIEESPAEEIEEEGPASEESEEVAAALEMESEGGHSAPDTEEGQPDSPEGERTAEVREQGGRYQHRVSRRMRRKMRGATMPEGKFDPARGGPPPAPIAEAPIAKPEPAPRPYSRPERPPLPSITELLKEGQEIIVQIAKEPLGQKGARITSHIALPGRYVVFMPTLEHTGVSRKIASDEERLRLKKILQIHHVGIAGGFIVRTAGEGKTEEEIAADMNFLFNLWLDIRQKAEKRPAPLLLHHDLDIVQRTLRDQFTENFKAIWVDNEELYESVLRFVQRFQPSLVSRVKLYTRPEPIFDAFNITAELEKALRPKVWLKSGGYIVINQTEALVAIDVNTGKYVGKSNRLEDTIVKTNTEAVKEIVRQMRLRDLGGIIVVDFIDMDERKNRQKVMQALEDAMRSDRAPYKILQFNDFGLVAITRKRVKQSLERELCMPCPHCEGAGYIKSNQTVVGEILQEAHKIANIVDGKDAMLRVHPDVAKILKSNQNKYLEELEEILRRPVLVKADPFLHHEKFDLI